jgi:hypothetical protein
MKDSWARRARQYSNSPLRYVVPRTHSGEAMDSRSPPVLSPRLHGILSAQPARRAARTGSLRCSRRRRMARWRRDWIAVQTSGRIAPMGIGSEQRRAPLTGVRVVIFLSAMSLLRPESLEPCASTADGLRRAGRDLRSPRTDHPEASNYGNLTIFPPARQDVFSTNHIFFAQRASSLRSSP